MDGVVADGEADYRSDEHAWLLRQAALLRAGRLKSVDSENLAEFLEDMAKRDVREVGSRLVVLLHHLLKFQVQPERATPGALPVHPGGARCALPGRGTPAAHGLTARARAAPIARCSPSPRAPRSPAPSGWSPPPTGSPRRSRWPCWSGAATPSMRRPPAASRSRWWSRI
ncbi:DUF29 family protein [Leptolyngbya sp. 15MV]|nr:DUF29 family protein [Leptolyngbya sp. 15MV]